MSAESSSFSVVIFNRFQPQADIDNCKARLSKLLKATPDQIENILLNDRTVLKKSIDKETADRYRSALEATGVLVKVIESPTTLTPKVDDVPPPSQTTTPTAQPPIIVEHPKPDSSHVFCRNCGSAISVTALQCNQCGRKQTIGTAKSKTTSAILALLCGGFGIHRLYLGQWWGILYLFIWPISSVISVIESIVFALTPKEKWDRKYGDVINQMNAAVVIVSVFLAIAVIGILAAIALPAYNDYVNRAKVEGSISYIHEQLELIETYAQETSSIPSRNDHVNLPSDIADETIRDIQIGAKAKVTVTFTLKSSQGQYYTMIYEPTWTEQSVNWDCTEGTLPARWRPKSCRNKG